MKKILGLLAVSTLLFSFALKAPDAVTENAARPTVDITFYFDPSVTQSDANLAVQSNWATSPFSECAPLPTKICYITFDRSTHSSYVTETSPGVFVLNTSNSTLINAIRANKLYSTNSQNPYFDVASGITFVYRAS